MVHVGVITVAGVVVGSITQGEDETVDSFVPDLEGYEPQGRAAEAPIGGHGSGQGHSHASSSGHHGREHRSERGATPQSRTPRSEAPSGQSYAPGTGGSPFQQGSAETDRAIVEAAEAHRLDPNTMRSIASIESSMNPSSNAHRPTQYKGLYQVGRNEWQRFGEGNIYSARDNAMGAARMFDANRAQFQKRFRREPTDTELYMMHQQGLGFYTRNAMTNIGGNPYPGMRGPQTHESFEAGWGREVARRKERFKAANPAPVAVEHVPDPTTEPM